MNGNELIAALQKLTPEQRELPVYIRHPAQCCCNECFCPSDDLSEADAPTVNMNHPRGWPHRDAVMAIIEL